MPKVDAEAANKLYSAVAEVIKKDIPSSMIAPALGGIAVALARSAMAGRLGVDVDLSKVPHVSGMSAAEILFSESNSRFIITCRPEKSAALEKALAGFTFAKVGKTDASGVLNVRGEGVALSLKLEDMLRSYKGTLAGV
ncbi:Phosphoribosylformylglycinamidine synthase subunit PurL [bioreactor metagenome]|uniref:Phosphoribosylformylglycinamidine synthase subunit PurL n=1 Tax=bioreactor metagenome TaxID=1076179 RepID=A0A645IE00_9ZZZZ